MSKPTLISGIQPSGKLHIGNYLGALKNFVELQDSNKYQCYFFIADLHSLTEDFDPKEKPGQIEELIIAYLAAGLDPKKSIIFIQSQIPQHAELACILNSIAPFGELKRMTQFKEKAGITKVLEKMNIDKEIENLSKNININNIDEFKKLFKEIYKKNIERLELTDAIMGFTNIGLLDYPVLMAADILLYDAQFVPVGEDQLQHLELARTLARKFNQKFGKTFVEPQPLLTSVPRVMSLDNPTKKMSKSAPAGCLFLDDSPEIIKEKIKKSVTDSGTEIKYDSTKKPAISNLLDIYSAASNEPIKNLEKEYKGKTYVEFKDDLAEAIISELRPFQENKEKIKVKSQELKAMIQENNQKAEKIAQAKLIQVKEKIGLCK